MLNRGAPNWLKAWALRLAVLRGRKRATIALARRIGVVLHRMWRDGTRVPLHPRGGDGGAPDGIVATRPHRPSTGRRNEPRLKLAITGVPSRDAVPDDAHGSPCSPYRPVAVEHARQIGTRESSWTWHHVGGRRADHGRKREPGDGHIPNRPFSGPEDVQVEQPRPAPGCLPKIANTLEAMQHATGAKARDRKPGWNGPSVEDRA